MRCEVIFPQPLRHVRVRTVALEAPSVDGIQIHRVDPRAEAAARAEEERVQRIEVAAALQRAFDSVGPQVDQRLNDARDWIIELGFELAARILGSEIDRGNYAIQEAIRGCLDAAFETDTALEVVVHPEDADAANEVLEALQKESGSEILPRVTHNLSLARGSCRVETKSAQFRHDPRALLAESTDRLRAELAS